MAMLRHTFTSNLLSNGAAPKDVQLSWEELRKEVPPKTFVKPAGCD